MSDISGYLVDKNLVSEALNALEQTGKKYSPLYFRLLAVLERKCDTPDCEQCEIKCFMSKYTDSD